MRNWRRFIWPAVFFACSLFLLFWTNTLLWIAFLALSIFYLGVDVYSVDRRPSQDSAGPEKYVGPFGVLGDYVVDSTDSHGLFIELLSAPVFVDIRQDEFLEQREQQAQHLFANCSILEESLVNFVNANREFAAKRVSYIGLHSAELDQGEVFWKPSGHTLLKGTAFSA